MIGAMPAVAVRQQRKHIRHEEAAKHRPSTLTIDQGPTHQMGAHTPLKSPRASPHNSPVHVSPVTSNKSPVRSPKSPKVVTHSKKAPKNQDSCGQNCVTGYLFGRISLLHISILFVLLGITLLVIGLIQLAPSTTTNLVDKTAFIGSGVGFLGLGFAILILLCICQKSSQKNKRNQPPRPQQIQKQAKGRKGKQGSKTSVRTATKANQVPTIDGAMSAPSSGKPIGRNKSEVHPSDQPPVTDFAVINEKENDVTNTPKAVANSGAAVAKGTPKNQQKRH